MSRESELLKYADTANLTIGQRVRSRRYPELTGMIRWYEWNEPGVLSAIPYNVSWDDSDRAYDVLGMFFMYATDTSIEAVPDG